MPGEERPPKRIELWMRSFAPAAAGPNHERALERVEALEARPEVEAIDVRVWGQAVELTDRHARIPQLRDIQERLDAFEDWARHTGRTLDPFFRTRQINSTLTGEQFEIQRLPTLAVAEYRDDELVHVAPSRDGNRMIDALDRLEALVRGEVDTTVAFEERTSVSSTATDSNLTVRGKHW